MTFSRVLPLRVRTERSTRSPERTQGIQEDASVRCLRTDSNSPSAGEQERGTLCVGSGKGWTEVEGGCAERGGSIAGRGNRARRVTLTITNAGDARRRGQKDNQPVLRDTRHHVFM